MRTWFLSSACGSQAVPFVPNHKDQCHPRCAGSKPGTSPRLQLLVAWRAVVAETSLPPFFMADSLTQGQDADRLLAEVLCKQTLER